MPGRSRPRWSRRWFSLNGRAGRRTLLTGSDRRWLGRGKRIRGRSLRRRWRRERRWCGRRQWKVWPVSTRSESRPTRRSQERRVSCLRHAINDNPLNFREFHAPVFTPRRQTDALGRRRDHGGAGRRCRNLGPALHMAGSAGRRACSLAALCAAPTRFDGVAARAGGSSRSSPAAGRKRAALPQSRQGTARHYGPV